MTRNILILLILGFSFSSCMKDFSANPESPDSWSPSWSVPIGSVVVPFDTTVFDGFLPYIPMKKDGAFPVRFEDYPAFIFDQEEIVLYGTLAFDFSSLVDDFTQVKLVRFILETQNGFPTGVNTSLLVKDANQNTLFSLVEENTELFNVPNLDNNELVTQPAVANPVIEMSESKILDLQTARYLEFELGVSTQRLIDGILDVDTVTFKRNYSIGIEVGLRVDLDIQF